MENYGYQKCAESCEKCAKICLENVDKCQQLTKAGMDCSTKLTETGYLCAKIADMIRTGQHLGNQLGICAFICELCARECDRAQDDRLSVCAYVCRDCAEACKQAETMPQPTYYASPRCGMIE